MKRRAFITLLGGAAAWPLAARAQQGGKVPTIGFLGTNPAMWSSWTGAFVQRMRELGWIEGRTVAVEYRWSEGHAERVADIAAEFVRRKVDVIVSYGTVVPTIMRATSTIPIVFAIAIDPLGSGLVASLARPGGNVTGLSSQASDLAGKRVELLREVAPRLRRLIVIANILNPQATLEMGEVQAAARRVSLEVVPLVIQRAEDIDAGFAALKGQADALYIVQDALTVANRPRIVAFALGARMPAVVSARDFVQAGVLMSYGPSYPANFRRAAEYVDKILRGTKPGDIPVEQPTKFDLSSI